MATYKDIVGTAVRNNAGNIPTAETGQVFFDSTNLDFKYQFPNLSSGSWRSSIDVNTARRTSAGIGDVDNGLLSGGYATANSALTEIWNGSSWTETGDLNTARRAYAAGGTYTAAITGGGYTTTRLAVTESWNGSA